MTTHSPRPSPPVAPEDRKIRERSRYRRLFAACGVGWALDGFDYTMFSLAMGAILVSLNLDVADGGRIVTISLMASALGGIIGGVLADRYDRVKLLTWVMIGFSVFTGLTALAQNYEQLLLFRSLEGFFFGSEWAIGASMMAEAARPERRGRTMSMLQSLYHVGYAGSVLCYFALFSLLDPDVAWRVLFVVGTVPAAVAIVIRLKVEDPPRPATDTTEGFDRAKLLELFRGRIARRTVPLLVLQCAGQMYYYAVVSFFPLYLSEERGLDIGDTSLYLWLTVLGSFAGAFVSGFVADRIGRRPTFQLYYVGVIVMSLVVVLVPVHSLALNYLVMLAVGIVFAGTGGLLGSFFSELYPTPIRATGMSFVYNTSRAVGALGPLVVGETAAAIGIGNAMITVAVSAAVVANVALWCLPETRGKDLADI
ncbi:MFS transporter [Saccharomonospora cyanea]|uniref:Sugar phosphate permease n=1 Tax=Saccharomonospora cyanea NA-134 TaxID=882082 RepID=H5XJV9_9PSEU|nr:MFS transporter [Saccharomonospora cyanea]EHR61874.1 sugar phosphate permease [Saccharomonospora cyanea NA-134]